MAFLHPAFLWALFALAIPVIIHLFQLRRFKRVDFPNVRFLKEVTQQTRSRRNVRHWLVLLTRMAALAALVLAFAQPYIPADDQRVVAGQRAVSIFIDDSFSMDGENADGRLLDQARTAARDVIMSHAPTDRFQLLGGQFAGRQQLLMDRDQALEAATRMETGPYSRPLSQVMARQREALSRSDAPARIAVLLTDMQRSITDVEQWTDDTTITTLLVPLPPGATDNLSLDSAWFGSPVRRAGQMEDLHVRLTNHGEQDLVNVPLRLRINDQQRALASFSLPANSVLDTLLRFTSPPPGMHRGELMLDDGPVTFDDRLYISYHVAEAVNVMIIGDAASEGITSLKAVFEKDDAFKLTETPLRAIDIGELDAQDLVLLASVDDIPSGTAAALERFVDNGGSLAIFPAPDPDMGRFSEVLMRFGVAATGSDTSTIKVDRIDLDQPFYSEVFLTMPRNVDLPVVRERIGLRPPAGSDVLLRLQDGSPFLLRTDRGRGQVYLGAAPLHQRGGSFLRHALFVTTMLRMGELSRPMGPLYHTLGEDVRVVLPGVVVAQDDAPRLIGPSDGSVLPEVQRGEGATTLVLHDQDLLPGIHVLATGNDTLALVALNLARRESDLSAYTPVELKELLDQSGASTFRILEERPDRVSHGLKHLDEGRRLWKWFIALALLFLISEAILLRLFR